MTNVPIAEVLSEITRQSRIKILYADRLLQNTPRVTIKAANITIREALDRALQSTDLEVVTIAGQLTLVSKSAQLAAAQNSGLISGSVLDSSTKKGIPGVTISVSGSNLFATTNERGEYIIRNVPIGQQVIQFRLLGFSTVTRTVQIAANNRVTLQVTLKQTANMLSGVVTTATGTQKKLEVGNSITTLNVDSIMQTAPITSVTDLLESRVPGLTVQRTSGAPGDPARIRLRGASSIYQNNDPIIIVDGIRVYSQQSDDRNLNAGGKAGVSQYATPSPLDQIDPNTIETIEVFKGPSASALYGSDAANGVIVINTKRGQAGPARWNVASNYGISEMSGKWPVGIWKFATGIGGGASQVCIGLCQANATVDSIRHFQALNDPRFTALGTGSETGVSTSVSGGTRSIQYSFTTSLRNTIGMLKLPNSEADRYRRERAVSAPGWMRQPEQLAMWSLNGQMAVEINSRANATVTSMLTRQNQRRTSMSNSVASAIGELEGRYIDESNMLTTPLLGNPFERITSNMLTVTNAVQLRYQPVSWLPMNGTFGLSNQFRDDQNILARGMLKGVPDSAGFLRAGHNSVTNYSGSINTNAQIRERLSVALGLNYMRSSTNDLRGAFSGLPIGVTNPSGGISDSGSSFNRYTTGQQTFGWFVEPKLNISSRFFALPGFRLDNNGLAGKNAKLLGLPKINLSWIASEEPLFPLGGLFQLFRLRGAFGVAGVQPSPTDALRLFMTESYGVSGDAMREAYGDILQLSNLGNTKLRPERGYEFEGGIDAELLDGRVTVDVTQYRKLRIDAIVSNPLSTSVGGGNIRMNVGDILNTGTELAISARVIERRAIGWNVNMAMSRNRNKVVQLGEEYSILMKGPFATITTRYVAGYPMNGIWERPIYGYVDLDNDGFITYEELLVGSDTAAVYLGASDPNYQLNVTSGLTLFGGRLNMNTTFAYVGGLTQRDLKSMNPTFGGSGYWMSSPFALAINDPNSPLSQHAAIIAAQSSTGRNPSGYGMVRTTNTLRMQSFSIGTNLSPQFARKLHARTIGIALQGSNLWMWSNYQGKDPNVNAFSTGQMTGDTGQLPQPRTWSLRVTVGG